MVVILIAQVKSFFKYFRRKEFSQYWIFLVVACAYFGFTMNSMTHNESIITGNVILWSLWGAAFALLQEFKYESLTPEIQ